MRQRSSHPPSSRHPRIRSISKEETIPFSKEQQWALDFGTQLVTAQNLRENLRVAAETVPRTGGEVAVIAPIAGRVIVEKTFAVGTAVEKGSALVSMIPPTSAVSDLASLQLAETEAKVTVEQAGRDRARAERLLAAGAVPARRAEEARAVEATAQARLQAAQARLAQYDATRTADGVEAGAKRFFIRAPIGGILCPGLSVTVAANNEIVFSSALGMADVEQGVPLKTTSVHRLASLSKPITGTIIMDLVSQGRLSLDAPVRRYLPGLPEAYTDVTLRHLLDHQSGVGGAEGGDVAFSVSHYATSRDALKVFMDRPIKFKPGTKTEYSSLAFTVAGAAAESVTGQSFQKFSADFFTRHGITGFFLDDPLTIVPARVRGYLVDPSSKIEFSDGRTMSRDYLAGTTGPITNARAYDISNRYPAGGFDSSGENLLRFVIAISTGKVLPPQTVHEMWSAQTTSDGTRGVFGIGWECLNGRGNKWSE